MSSDNEDLIEALDPRGVIGQSVGLLLARRDVSEAAEAFEMLVQWPSDSQERVREIAAAIVRQQGHCSNPALSEPSMNDRGALVAVPAQASQRTGPREQTMDAIARVSRESFDTEQSLAAALGDAKAEIEGLREALRSRTIIGQATGLLMRDLGLSTEGAFEHLVELSSHSQVKVRVIAARMLAQADREARLPAPGRPSAHGRARDR